MQQLLSRHIAKILKKMCVRLCDRKNCSSFIFLVSPLAALIHRPLNHSEWHLTLNFVKYHLSTSGLKVELTLEIFFSCFDEITVSVEVKRQGTNPYLGKMILVHNITGIDIILVGLVMCQEWFQKFQWKFFKPYWRRKLVPFGNYCNQKRKLKKLKKAAVLHKRQKYKLLTTTFEVKSRLSVQYSKDRILVERHFVYSDCFRECFQLLCNFWVGWLPVILLLDIIGDAIIHLEMSFLPFQRKKTFTHLQFWCLEWKQDETREQRRRLCEMFCVPWHFRWMDSHTGQLLWMPE